MRYLAVSWKRRKQSGSLQVSHLSAGRALIAYSAPAWQTQEALDAFEKSDVWEAQREKLANFSSTPLVTQHCRVDGQFYDALTDNTAITDVYFPTSLSAEAKEKAEKVRGLVYFMAPGRGKPMAYSRRGSRGWVQGTVEYEGRDAVVLRFWNYWKSKESEEQFKGSAGTFVAGGNYVKLTEYLEEQLREAGMLGAIERHCKFVEVPFFFS